MKKGLIFILLVMATYSVIAQQTDTVHHRLPNLITFNGFSFKKGDMILKRRQFGNEIYQSPDAIKYYKRGRLNEAFTILLGIGGVTSLVHTDIRYIYTKKEQTKRQILNIAGLAMIATSILTTKFYLRNMGKAIHRRNQDILLAY